MKEELKQCPCCGNTEVKMQVVESRYNILFDEQWCCIDFTCEKCGYSKTIDLYGINEDDCKNGAIRIWDVIAKGEQNDK